MAITHEWQVIDADKALVMLGTMDGNRSLRQPKIDHYAEQMAAGLWRETPEGIMFDTRDKLIDGQHRLWAIVESKSAVKLLVFRGVREEDVSVLNTGTPRNYIDTAHYAGWEENDPVVGSIAKMIVLGPSYVGRSVPFEVLHNWYEFYKEGIDFAKMVRNNSRSGGLSSAIPYAVAAVFARAAYTAPHEKLDRMGHILRTGQIESKAETAAATFRDVWISKRLGRATEQYQKTEGAVRAFIERRPITKIIRIETELFPVPKLPKALEYRLTKKSAKK